MSEWAVRQDEDELPERTIVLVVVAATVIAALFVLWTWFMIERPATGTLAEKPREVGLVDQPLFDVREGTAAKLDGEKRRILGGWGWVDRSRGVARIPIEEAMRLVVEGTNQ